MRIHTVAAVLNQSVFGFDKLTVSATVLSVVERAEAEQTVHMLCVVAGIVFAVAVFKIRRAHLI